jgi:hypothetical protein
LADPNSRREGFLLKIGDNFSCCLNEKVLPGRDTGKNVKKESTLLPDLYMIASTACDTQRADVLSEGFHHLPTGFQLED